MTTPHEEFFAPHPNATWPEAFIEGPDGPRGICWCCGRPNRVLVNTGTEDIPYYECGTCQHRHERRINAREMWGRGRRGY